jgi:hypothetical protein
MLVNQTTWDLQNSDGVYINQGKFADVDTDTFRVPRLYVTGFLRGVDGSRLSGTWEDLQLFDHSHQTNEYDGAGSTPSMGRYYSVSNGNPNETTGALKSDGTSLGDKVGTQNRPANTGTYILLRI